MKLLLVVSMAVFVGLEALAVTPVIEGQTQRPLRYTPVGTDFVIVDGPELFNRPLYGWNNSFRVDGGDKPEFSFYRPGRGGNLRLGIQTSSGAKWLNDIHCTARYRPGSYVYELQDELLGSGSLTLIAMTTPQVDGLILRAQGKSLPADAKLLFAFGGATGERGSRNGDIGTEKEPVSRFFALRSEYCKDNTIALHQNGFDHTSKVGVMHGVFPLTTTLGVGDAKHWQSATEIQKSIGKPTDTPVVVGSFDLESDKATYFAIYELDPKSPVQLKDDQLPSLFEESQKRRDQIANRVVVDTPDPFINAAASALCVGADALWDKASGGLMHGGVAWRTNLLGWRGGYAPDALGWHDRAAGYLRYWAGKQNLSPELPTSAKPNVERNLSCDDYTMLHSNGDMCGKHYDMNLAYIDILFRHLLWTGDKQLAKELWPTITRHLAWEQRNFRRTFGDEKLPLYEAYCCIWASDNLQYSGGGVTHASAYNYFHNKMAARVATWIGEDPAPYEKESQDILKAMRSLLWIKQTGSYAECKDLLGKQLLHPAAAVWTVYHTIDSQACSPMEAYQLGRYIDTQIPHIPIHGPGVPEGDYAVVSSSNWMPYIWSTNNICPAETTHTALAQWQANKPKEAFSLFKGSLLDTMYMGKCPGNIPMASPLDPYRGESQRDSADPTGITTRALVEGLFGITPDAIAGEILIKPGFPKEWDRACIKHPDFNFSFVRSGDTETYTIETKSRALKKVRLFAPALLNHVQVISKNATHTKRGVINADVNIPRIQIDCEPADKIEVTLKWSGQSLDTHSPDSKIKVGEQFPPPPISPNAEFIIVPGPGDVSTTIPARSTLFMSIVDGDVSWVKPYYWESVATTEVVNSLDPRQIRKWDSLDLSTCFNDRVTQIFKREYLSPRSPFCSLSIPKQGVGGWCDYKADPEIDDSGLRKLAQQGNGRIVTPISVPFTTPGEGESNNIAFVSQWDNHPKELIVPANGKAKHLYLLMTGSTNSMQSRIDNGELIVTYADDSTARLALRNPETWWPIEQDYFVDDYSFRIDAPLPPRLNLKTGEVRVLDAATFKGKGGKVPGGAATILNLPLDPTKELKSITVRSLSNESIIGLMSATLARE